MKAIKYTLLAFICTVMCSCVTSYDRYGNPIQTVDPVVATVGAVALGAVAYNAGQNNSNYNNRYYGSGCSSYSRPVAHNYYRHGYRPHVPYNSYHNNRYNRCHK